MVSVNVNGIEILVKPGVSILEACKYAGLNLPRFCYHEILSVSGNCRMCLVEVEALEKPVASCVTEVTEGMIIYVDSPFVKKARENVVETLLLNHPLDCPICDQAGECDLQDQTKNFGSSYSRFFFKKKGVEDKYCGPLIKTIMTRCITCTRCVRYAAEVAGVEFFGTINRGSGTEIGAYLPKIFDSEISGNVIDLCPVGALTSRPYAFKARPWELRLVESVDITDSFGANIYVNYKETEIARVLPKSNNDINGSIISDKARFSYDANHINRVNHIFNYSKDSSKFNKISWASFFNKVDTLLNESKIDVLIDEKCDTQTLHLLRKLVNKYPSKINIVSISKTNSLSNVYLNNQTNIVNTINNTYDLIVLVGTNLRLESAVLNSIIRFRYKNTLLKIASFGLSFSENIPTSFINLNVTTLLSSFEGKVKNISKLLVSSKTPLIFLGENFADRVDNIANTTNLLSLLLPDAKIINLKNSANSVGLHFLNLQQSSVKQIKNTVLAINLDDNILTRKLLKNAKKALWLNTHGSKLATKFNTIVPALTSFETEQTYFNLEARPQKTQKAFTTFFDAKSTFDIVGSIFNIQNSEINLAKENFLTSSYEQIVRADLYSNLKDNQSPFSSIVKKIVGNKLTAYPISLSKYPMKQKLKDFYSSDTITRNSNIMQECSSELKHSFTNFYIK